MQKLAEARGLDFVMLLGDNFYRYGIESTEDPQWRYKFENMYRGPALDHVPFYAVLGNHDYGGNEQAEIQYSREHLGSGRWHMPARDYVEYYGEAGNKPLLKVIYLDTSPFTREHEDTVRKLSSLLTNSKPSHWTLVASHVPVRTSSRKYFDKALVDLILPVLKRYNVDAYLSGHDHNQQLIM
jgi:predicted MPP superfamily phosphohydrolase